MRKFHLVIFCFLFLATGYGQTGTRMYTAVNVEITKEKKPKKISTKVEISSVIPGADSSLIQSLVTSLNQAIPYKNGAKAGTYLVAVRLLIEKDGSMADYRCLNDPGYGMCEQVLDVLKRKLRGHWGPSVGTKVREYHNSNITSQ